MTTLAARSPVQVSYTGPERAGDYNELIRLVQFNLHIDARWQFQLHQGIDRLVRRVENIHQPLMRPKLILVAGILVYMRRNQDRKPLYFVGNGIGPWTLAPVRFAVSTISRAELSINR